jgi:hypothetical protein
MEQSVSKGVIKTTLNNISGFLCPNEKRYWVKCCQQGH